MDSSPDRLTPSQHRFLQAFFEAERGFFLTGGAALAGYHLRHRATDDLDLFTTEAPAFEAGLRTLRDVAARLGATVEVTRDSPTLRRCVVQLADEALVVDLVYERVAQVHPDKLDRGGIRLDPLDEILVNKLTTILSRAEERDLVDLLHIERTGLRVEDALAKALAKDGGCTAAALAHLLSEVRVPADARLPGEVSGVELEAYVRDLTVRLRRRAFPG